jgi:hypothetical protein
MKFLTSGIIMLISVIQKNEKKNFIHGKFMLKNQLINLTSASGKADG